MSLVQELNQIIAERHLLTHPMYQAWSKGELCKETLQHYAAQYYHQVQSFPRFVSRVHTNCPDIEVRKALLRNLVDEEIHGTDHPALWMQFAEGIGANRARVNNEVAIPETQAMVDTYYRLAEDWQSGLCALYAYEYQVPEVSTSKMDGLKKFYGIEGEEAEKTLEFFAAHQVYDVEHAQQVADLIEKYVDPELAKKATREARDALWVFLDGICRENGIACEMAA